VILREFSAERDAGTIKRIHAASGLPENCMPATANPLFLVKAVVEYGGHVVMASFLKGTSEVYLLVDHDQGTPEQRWEWLKELKVYMERRAWELGLDEMTCWIPPEMEKTFGKRLEELSFVKSPWSSYTLPLRNIGS
jgi:hypothetical protein